MSSPSRIVEVIPIDVSESYQLADKQLTITTQGIAQVTAAGDAYFSLSITTSELYNGSTKTITTRSSATVTVPAFVKYRDAVAAFNRGEIDLPLPQASKQQLEKLVYTGPKYYWYGIKFVAPGDPVYYIDFDHPDNFDTYYPGQWNTNWLKNNYPGQSGWLKWAHHTASGTMQQAILFWDLYLAIMPFAAAFGFEIYWLVGVILAILWGIGLGVWAFLTAIMQSEQLDGWSYTHDNLINHDRLISFGAWRDWGWGVGKW